MPEKIKLTQSVASFRAYLNESITDKTAIVLWIDKNIHLVGLVDIVQEITQGLIPLFIARTPKQYARIQSIFKQVSQANVLSIFEIKHNLTDDEPRLEQLIFDWSVNEDGILDVKTSYSLVGQVRHRGWQS